MDPLPRIYEAMAARHLAELRQMCFLVGPRQVGKTTSGRAIGAGLPRAHYLSWDDEEGRKLIQGGQGLVARACGLDALAEAPVLCIFDELHKFAEWKNFLKALFDKHSPDLSILVTGSARLDVYRRGGDSLMGRYFSYRMHPLSVAELLDAELRQGWFRPPERVDEDAFEALLVHGGFPEPFSKARTRFTRRWRRSRTDLLFREDLRDGTRLQDLARVRMLAVLLEERAGQLCSFSSLARQVRTASDTLRRWTEVLESFFYCFTIRPYSKNLRRALRKEPKFYLWDWSSVSDPGRRFENFVACALLKAAHAWTDTGLGDVELYFVRDKQKREVDFLLVRDRSPWILVETKTSPAGGISKALELYHHLLGTDHAFQVVLDSPYVDADCFARSGPVIVPARTFLSQLW